MSKKCEYCGSGIKDGAKFCEACGAPVKQKDEVKAPKKENKTEEFSKNRAEQKSTEQRPAQKPVFRGVSIMLAVMLCIELAVAGFKYPGFFVKHDYDSNALLDRIKNAQSGETGDSGTQNLSYDAMEEREYELNADTAPATPAVINVRVSDEEVAAAVPEKAAVSKESHVCAANGVTVDFKPWNLNGDDTLAVRSIGERSDEENGVSLEIYDFSLESGQNKFLTSVDVSIPRPQDGSGDGVVYYNPETDSWEPTSYDISDDGKYYILHTTHFSRDAVIKKDISKWTAGGVDALGPFYLEVFVNEGRDNASLLQHPVSVSDESISAALKQTVDSQDLTQIFEFKGNMKKEATMGYVVDAMLGHEVSAKADGTYSLADTGNSVLLGIFQENSFFKSAGDRFSKIGSKLLAFRIGYALWMGESPDNIFKDLSVDAVSAGLSAGLGYAATAGVISGGTALVAAGVVALTSYVFGDSVREWLSENVTIGEPDRTLDAYKSFCQTSMAYDDKNGVKHPLKLDGTGWNEYLAEELTDVPAEKRALKLIAIMDNYFDGFWRAENKNIADNYIAQYNLKLTNAYRTAENLRQESMPEQFKTYSLYTADVKEIARNRYKTAAKKTLFRNIKPLLKDIYKTALDEMEIEFKKDIQQHILPYMNMEMEFVIRDGALKDGETFEKSIYGAPAYERAEKLKVNRPSAPSADPYAIDPNMFNPDTGVAGGTVRIEDDTLIVKAQNANQLLYAVGSFDNVKESIKVPPCYEIDGFLPCVSKGSNTVLKCRMYYYMKFGSPTTLSLKGDTESGAEPLSSLPIVFSRKGQSVTAAIDISGKRKEAAGSYLSIDKPEDKDWYEYTDLLDYAIGNAAITMNSDGSFSGSGTASKPTPRTSSSGTYSASVSISGKIDPKTNKGTCTVSGSMSGSDTGSESGEEKMDVWIMYTSSNWNHHYNCEFSGGGEAEHIIESKNKEGIIIDVDLHFKETRRLKSNTVHTNNLNDNVVEDPVDDVYEKEWDSNRYETFIRQK